MAFMQFLNVGTSWRAVSPSARSWGVVVLGLQCCRVPFGGSVAEDLLPAAKSLLYSRFCYDYS